MHNAVETMLQKYQCKTESDYINALKEIFQEIALLGLWRAKFFEHAAFYGGTALRILYGLDRFSEDMDFSLLLSDKKFNLKKYNEAIAIELKAFGFDVEVVSKVKSKETAIESAFIKANTIKQLLTIEVPEKITTYIHNMNTIKIKMEVDTDPPGDFTTDAKQLLMPIPFSVLTFSQQDLFAGKMHALLCRAWATRIKGRDWYDFVWYVSRQVPLNLKHLEARLRQSGHWQHMKKLDENSLKDLINDKIEQVDFNAAKDDVLVFLRDKAAVEVWSKAFFRDLIDKINYLT